MTSTTHRQEFTAAALYLACELSTKEWLLTMSTAPDGRRQRARCDPGMAALRRVVTEAKRDWGWPRRRRCGLLRSGP